MFDRRFKKPQRVAEFLALGAQGRLESERRKSGGAAFGKQLGCEPREIVICERSVESVARVARLDEHLSGQVCAAGTAGDLLQQRKCLFAAAIVARKKTAVCVEDARERQALEVVPLGENLRTNQDVGSLGASQQTFQLAPAARSVAVQTQYPRARQARNQRCFYALGAASERLQVEIAALWARAGDIRGEAAVMAA